MLECLAFIGGCKIGLSCMQPLVRLLILPHMYYHGVGVGNSSCKSLNLWLGCCYCAAGQAWLEFQEQPVRFLRP